MKNLTLGIILAITSNLVKAQLYFKNSSSKPVLIAYVMQNNAKSDEAWYSHGWYSCDPGQTIMISSAVGLNPNVYWYAKAKDGSTVWNGEEQESGRKMLVSQEAFSIKNCNLQYVKDDNPEYYWVTFRHITIAALQTKYTITISD